MRFRYQIYPSSRAIVARFTGTWTLGELIKAIHELWSHPDYSPAFDGIVDLTARDVSVDIRELRPVLDFVRDNPRTSTGRWAAVADSPLATACGLIYRRALCSRHAFDVFSTREAACEFVGFQLGAGELFSGQAEPQRN
jgi:hypothetical protein